MRIPGPRTGQKLEGWKEIASFLEVTERTAQRWTREKWPLPIYSRLGRVHAYTDELDVWLRGFLIRKRAR